jgi:CDP-paratose 2-epimerase
VAHFLIRALEGMPITIYGDGRQVRDLLYIDDAVAAYRALLDNIGRLEGRVFNLGGGPANAVSINTVVGEIERLIDRRIALSYADWRHGDQLYFTADTRRLEEIIGWRPTLGWREGIARLHAWLVESRGIGRRERRAVA